MIISHKHKFIFIKTEKTAGTSIEIALSRICGDQDIITPISEKDEALRKSLGYRSAQNYLIPFSKYSLKDWSYFLYHRKRRKFFNHISARRIMKFISPKVWNSYYKFCFERNPWDKTISWYYWIGKNQTSLHEFIESGKANKIRGYDLYTVNDKIVVDKVYRMEDLDMALEDISNKIGLPELLSLSNIKAKGRVRKDKRHYRDILSQKEKDMITQIFEKEIDAFGYSY